MDQHDDALPGQVLVARDRLSMRLVWPDGREEAVSAHQLRSACRCAWCTRDRALERFKVEGAAVSLAGVEILGSHGLHIKFSDGHERGIFPWTYLRDIARGTAAPIVVRPVLAHAPLLQRAV